MAGGAGERDRRDEVAGDGGTTVGVCGWSNAGDPDRIGVSSDMMAPGFFRSDSDNDSSSDWEVREVVDSVRTAAFRLGITNGICRSAFSRTDWMCSFSLLDKLLSSGRICWAIELLKIKNIYFCIELYRLFEHYEKFSRSRLFYLLDNDGDPILADLFRTELMCFFSSSLKPTSAVSGSFNGLSVEERESAPLLLSQEKLK